MVLRRGGGGVGDEHGDEHLVHGQRDIELLVAEHHRRHRHLDTHFGIAGDVVDRAGLERVALFLDIDFGLLAALQ